MLNFCGSSHPIFCPSSAFERGELKKRDKKSTHFDGSDENIELFHRTVISANGAVAAPDHLETMVIPAVN